MTADLHMDIRFDFICNLFDIVQISNEVASVLSTYIVFMILDVT